MLPRNNAALGLFIALLLPIPLRGAEGKWDKVPPVDFSTIKVEDFKDDELDLPYYLGRFHELANAVVEDGPDRGFINLVVWRHAKDNKPYNARVMENHLSLAWFYTQNRPWNPYYNSPAVRDRLEAVLTKLCDMQNDDGRFSEYGPKQWNLPATAFATKFFGETITLLQRSEAKIDSKLFDRVIEADKKAILATLTLDDLYKHGKSYTNQFGNVFAGAAAYLALFPDDKIKQLYNQRFKDAEKDFQSPCGYFYEANGPDFGYTLGTHHNNLHVTYFYLHDTPIGDAIIEQDKKWNDWLGYNLLRQPDGSAWVANRGIETRQLHASFDHEDGNLAEKVLQARAFATSKQERQRQVLRARTDLKTQWGADLTRQSGLPAGGSSPFSPYVFLQRRMPDWLPDGFEKEKALQQLPYVARDRFIHQRMDSRKPAVFTFIRKPAYYAIFNSGEHITPQQRLGLGILYTLRDGAILQTQTNSADHAFGTRAKDAEQVYESLDLKATFSIDDTAITPKIGNHDLPGGDSNEELKGELLVQYPLGEKGTKTLRFREDSIIMTIEHPGDFTEQLPLLAGTKATPNLFKNSAGIGRLVVEFPLRTPANWLEGPTLFGATKVQTLRLAASNSLTYTLRFHQ